jgi:hypothetical protein
LIGFRKRGEANNPTGAAMNGLSFTSFRLRSFLTRLRTFATVFQVTLVAAACSGDSPSAPPPPIVPASVKYSGVFASGVERGTITLTTGSFTSGQLSVRGSAAAASNGSLASVKSVLALAAGETVPATGTMTVGSGTAVPLSGTYTTATSTFAVSGGGFTVAAAAISSGTLSGTVTGAGITGVGTMSAVSTATASSSRFCGVYTGDDSGMFEIILSGSTAAATVSGMGGGFAMTGTVAGSTVKLTVTGKEPGSGKTNTLNATATIAGTELSGSGSSTLYPNDKVTLSGSSIGCAVVPSAGPFSDFQGIVGGTNLSKGVVSISTGSPPTGSLSIYDGTGTPGSKVSLKMESFDAAKGSYVMSYPGEQLNLSVSGVSLTGSTALQGKIVGLGDSPVAFCGTYGGTTSGRVFFIMNTPGGSNYAGTSMKLVGLMWTSVALSAAVVPISGSGSPSWSYAAAGASTFFAGQSMIVKTQAYPAGARGYTGTWADVNDGKGTWTASLC